MPYAAQTFLLLFAVAALRSAGAALRFCIGLVGRLWACHALLELVRLVVVIQSALGERELQLEILDLVDAQAPFGEAILDGCNCVF